MSMVVKIIRHIRLRWHRLFLSFFILPSTIKYWLLSNNKIHGNYKAHIPILCCGTGYIVMDGVNLGVWRAPHFFSSYICLDARSSDSKINIGHDVWINNNAYICADKTSIIIEDKCLIGVNFSCIDSDFHELSALNRNNCEYKCKPVLIKRNVFIGNNVTILKGVTIGENSIIGNGAVVTKSFPANVIIGGNPAKIIRNL